MKNCKSIRRKDIILHLYNTTNLSSAEIGEQVGLKSRTVRKVGIENNISLKRLNRRKTYQTDRNENLIEDIRKGKLSYKEIGKKYNITKQRVYQFAKNEKISRWEKIREKRKKLIINVKDDLGKGLTYQQLCERYGDEYYFHYVMDGGTYTHILEKRNQEILTKYKHTNAKSIITDSSPILDTPQRIGTTNHIYHIVSKKGYKKYPQIGNRSKGGLFESDRVIKLIKKLKNKNYSYRRIAEALNEKGWKSPMGKIYSGSNVQNKHKLIIKYKL